VNLDFWQTPESWPSDSPEYVFLARAFNEIGSAIFGAKWALPEDVSAVEREQDPNEDDSDEDALDNDNWDTDNDDNDNDNGDWDSDLEKMQADVEREIANQCLAGILVTAVRPKAGGQMIHLEPSHWHTENYHSRFYRCQMSLRRPFPTRGVIAPGSHWVYVTRESLDRYLADQLYAECQSKTYDKQKPAPQVKQSSSQEKKCKDWLIEEMQAHDIPPKPKKPYRDEAQQKFSVSIRGFDRAWADAIHFTGRLNWSNAGRKPKS
jgi:hypothetical protein